MKRKRLILTTVLLACVAAVVVPYRREIWFAVAYERVDADATSDDVWYWQKKFAWGPGTSIVVPDQVCRPCQRQNLAPDRIRISRVVKRRQLVEPVHGDCVESVVVVFLEKIALETRDIINWFTRNKVPEGVLNQEWHCTCTHGSHSVCSPCRSWGGLHLRCFAGGCTCPDPIHEWNR